MILLLILQLWLQLMGFYVTSCWQVAVVVLGRCTWRIDQCCCGHADCLSLSAGWWSVLQSAAVSISATACRSLCPCNAEIGKSWWWLFVVDSCLLFKLSRGDFCSLGVTVCHLKWKWMTVKHSLSLPLLSIQVPLKTLSKRRYIHWYVDLLIDWLVNF